MKPLLALAASFVVASSTALAQAAGPVERIGPARVMVGKDCSPATPGELTARSQESAVLDALGGPFAGLVGSFVGAGFTALGGAIEEASRAHAFGGQGVGAFNFYSVTQKKEGPVASFAPNMADGGSVRCVRIKINSAKDSNLDGLEVVSLLAIRSDGFEVLPVYVRYAAAVSSAPNRALPAELHLQFFTPGLVAAGGTPSETLGTAFAVARIPLPRLKPGDPELRASDLVGYRSGVLPLRPAASELKAYFDTRTVAAAAAKAKAEEAERLRIALVRAEEDARAKQPKPDAAVRVLAAKRQLEDGERERAVAIAALQDLIPQDRFIEGASTNVLARVVLVKDANRFGNAIGAALKASAPEFSAGVKTALTPVPEWTASDTAYVEAMVAVDGKSAELNMARSTADAARIATLEGELRVLQARANAAAVGAKKSIPFPGAAYGE